MTELRPFLNELQKSYHIRGFLSSDPLEFVHRYSDPWDQEAVALVAALLAYGNVKQIRRAVSQFLETVATLADSPAQFVRGVTADVEFRKRARKALSPFVHRFNRGDDLLLLFQLLGRSWREHGSLGAHFLGFLEPTDVDFSRALNALIAEWRRWAGPKAPESFQYLLTAPEDGSCCKRWCMLLRWMGRQDELDPGLWTRKSGLARTFPAGKQLRADQLILPLDTHVGRISQYLGLTRRKSLNWTAAVEITAKLRSTCDAADPVRYDFALARLGILDLCQRQYRPEICDQCQLVEVCQFARRGRRKAQQKK